MGIGIMEDEDTATKTWRCDVAKMCISVRDEKVVMIVGTQAIPRHPLRITLIMFEPRVPASIVPRRGAMRKVCSELRQKFYIWHV